MDFKSFVGIRKELDDSWNKVFVSHDSIKEDRLNILFDIIEAQRTNKSYDGVSRGEIYSALLDIYNKALQVDMRVLLDSLDKDRDGDRVEIGSSVYLSFGNILNLMPVELYYDRLCYDYIKDVCKKSRLTRSFGDLENPIEDVMKRISSNWCTFYEDVGRVDRIPTELELSKYGCKIAVGEDSSVQRYDDVFNRVSLAVPEYISLTLKYARIPIQKERISELLRLLSVTLFWRIVFSVAAERILFKEFENTQSEDISNALDLAMTCSYRASSEDPVIGDIRAKMPPSLVDTCTDGEVREWYENMKKHGLI